jgi:hypothetical protein
MAPIPAFPRLRPLAIGDRQVIEAVTNRFPPSSDFAYTSLWAWDADQTCAIALLNGNLVVRFADYETGAPFYSFLGDRAVVETAHTLLTHARAEGLPARLGLVPESVVAADPRLPHLLSVVPDRDNFDYLLDAADWDHLSGGSFKRHRRQLARCHRRTGLAIQPLDLRDAAIHTAIFDLFRDWANGKPTSAVHEHERERVALARLLAVAGCDRLWAFGIVDGDHLVAFSIFEGMPNSDVAVSHFQKTDRSYDGLGVWLYQERSRFLLARSYRVVNIEQDLGITGLRTAKLALRPCGFLRKYVISPCPPASLTGATGHPLEVNRGDPDPARSRPA